MAKNNKNQIEVEPVTKCDQLGMEVANSCLGKRPVGPSGDLQNINIESLIHIVRGQKVMFDSDLAMLYGVETCTLNQAVKRNITRFPDDFMFQVTKRNGRGQHRKFLLGASVKDMGAGMCAVTKMQVSPELILGLLK